MNFFPLPHGQGSLRPILRNGSLWGIPSEVLACLSEADLGGMYSKKAWSSPVSMAQFLIHLHGHLNYHLGQIDYLRRILPSAGAIDFVQL